MIMIFMTLLTMGMTVIMSLKSEQSEHNTDSYGCPNEFNCILDFGMMALILEDVLPDISSNVHKIAGNENHDIVFGSFININNREADNDSNKRDKIYETIA